MTDTTADSFPMPWHGRTVVHVVTYVFALAVVGLYGWVCFEAADLAMLLLALSGRAGL